MKKALLLIIPSLVLVSWSLVIAAPAVAEPVFTTIYPVTGVVSDPKGVGTEGRKVVLFKTDPTMGFADDLVGVAGLGGKADRYLLNAFEDIRLPPVKGKYKIGIVKGLDNYGANPVEFDLTGYGYDVVPASLVLESGAGLADPGNHPSSLAPRFDFIKFGNRRYQKDLVAKGQDFVISPSPRIEAKVTSTVGLNVNSLALVLNEGTANVKTLQIRSANIISSSGAAEAPNELTFVYDLRQENQAALPDGTQDLTFKAANSYGLAAEIARVTVAGGEAHLIGAPLAFPSPVNLRRDNQVTIQYTLSQDLNIDLRVIDLTGQVVKQFLCDARGEGGSAGVNKVVWDLKTQQGAGLGAGIYVATIVDRDSKKLLGKVRLTASGQ